MRNCTELQFSGRPCCLSQTKWGEFYCILCGKKAKIAKVQLRGSCIVVYDPGDGDIVKIPIKDSILTMASEVFKKALKQGYVIRRDRQNHLILE